MFIRSVPGLIPAASFWSGAWSVTSETKAKAPLLNEIEIFDEKKKRKRKKSELWKPLERPFSLSLSLSWVALFCQRFNIKLQMRRNPFGKKWLNLSLPLWAKHGSCLCFFHQRRTAFLKQDRPTKVSFSVVSNKVKYFSKSRHYCGVLSTFHLPTYLPIFSNNN